MTDKTITPEQISAGTLSPATLLPLSDPTADELASRDDLLLGYDRLSREVHGG
jgi:hypothetical protein